MANPVDSANGQFETKSDSPISRTISVESIGPKLTSLFRKRKRGSDDSDGSNDSSADSGHSSDDEASNHKRHKREKTQEEKEFEEREAQLDAELPEELRKYRPRGYRFNIPPEGRPIRIYADGVFDLFHLGHMKQLEQAKKAFENVELVCGIPSDIETHKRKGLTVLTDQQRLETLKHCRWVDETIPNAPWCVTPEFVKQHRIDYVAHDDLPYASSDSDDIYKPIKEQGRFLTTQRTLGISTSDIITKIIRDYDKYLVRNFARGATRKELNVSWLKKNELEFKKHINDFRSYWTKNRANLNTVSRDLYFEVREYMRGRKADAASLLEAGAANSDSEDSHSQPHSRAGSPLSDFAAKYIGNANKDLNRSIFKNVAGWMKRDEERLIDNLSRTPSDSINNASNSSLRTVQSEPARSPRRPVKRTKKRT